ncbi:MAG TPA: thiamine phosphate synthase [Gemmatimonadetes bacterium]|nr:thiamine phosphate synthase [Gemmatimonadota bacterium]
MVITDHHLAAPRNLLKVVEAALVGGAKAVQLRNKSDTAKELLKLGEHLRHLTEAHEALLFVNDRVDVALAIGADGIHLGPKDPPVQAVRRLVPDEFLIGFSADDPELARSAVLKGANYIGCGAIYATSTKPDAGGMIGLPGLRSVIEAVDVPVVAIGGITDDRIPEVVAAGATGVAVASAIMSASDPLHAARCMFTALNTT